MVNVEFRRKRLKRFPAKTTTDIRKVTLDTGYEPKDRVAKYEGERENPRQRIENSSFGSFELNTSHLNTTITNLTWKEACKQGGIDVQKIAKATREKVVIAQWNVSSWQPSIDQLMKEDFKPKSKISKDLVPLQNALAEISKNIRRAVETLGAWERLDQRSFEIIHPALNKLNDAKNMLIAKTRIHNEHVKTSGSRASRRAQVFVDLPRNSSASGSRLGGFTFECNR